MHLGDTPPPTIYGPQSYGNHTVTVEASTIDQVATITHQGKLLSDCGNC